MKKFKKLLISLLLLGAIGGLASCENAGYTATVPTEECEVKVVKEETSGKKTAVITLGLLNNTIYNVEQVRVTYNTYLGNEIVDKDVSEDLNIFIRHGVAGYLSYTYEVPSNINVDSVKITATQITKYSSLFDTYKVPFIIMFVIAGLGTLFFAIDLFKGGITKEGVKELFKEKLASTAVIMALVLLICLIPLFFASWVTTLILIGGFVGTGVLCGLLSLVRLATVRN